MPYDIVSLEDATSDTFLYLSEARVDCSLEKQKCFLSLTYGDKIPVDALSEEVGGNAANVAAGIAALGFKSALAGTVGNDERGKLIKKRLVERGVDTSALRLVKNSKTNYSVIITFQGERTILTYHHPRKYIPLRLPPSKWIYLSSLEPQSKPLHRQVWQRVKTEKGSLAFNPGSRDIRRGLSSLKPILRLTGALFVNQQEAETILCMKSQKGKQHIKKLLKTLLGFGIRIVVITDGRKGAYATDGSKYYYIATFFAKRIEPTGAGDSFSSGFLGAIMHGKQVSEALAWGSVNAASVITKIGSQVGLLNKSQIIQLLKKHKNYKSRVL